MFSLSWERKMLRKMSELRSDDSGQAMTEYAVVGLTLLGWGAALLLPALADLLNGLSDLHDSLIVLLRSPFA